jgi:hypothetical protein
MRGVLVIQAYGGGWQQQPHAGTFTYSLAKQRKDEDPAKAAAATTAAEALGNADDAGVEKLSAEKAVSGVVVTVTDAVDVVLRMLR